MKERDREREQHKKDEAISAFKALMADMVGREFRRCDVTSAAGAQRRLDVARHEEGPAQGSALGELREHRARGEGEVVRGTYRGAAEEEQGHVLQVVGGNQRGETEAPVRL